MLFQIYALNNRLRTVDDREDSQLNYINSFLKAGSQSVLAKELRLP